MASEFKKKIFITGWNGFLGKGLIDALGDSFDIVLSEGELGHVESWGKSLKGVSTLIHIAGCPYTRDAGLYERINAEGTRKLVEAAEKYGVGHFIFASTRVKAQCGSYGASKMKAEEYIRKSTLSWTIVRIAEVYDDTFLTTEGMERIGAVMQIAKTVRKNLIVPYLSGSRANMAPVHKDDVVACLRAVIMHAGTKNKIYTLAGPETLSLKEVLERVVRHLGRRRILIPIPLLGIRFLFWFLTSIVNLGVADQLERLVCSKDPLSGNVWLDLGLKPRRFLAR